MDNYEIKKAELKIQVLSSVAGAKGEEGESMYEIAKKNGFDGTEQEFIAQYMNVDARIGCYECDTDSSTSAKTVQGGKFILPTIPPYGGTIKVKFKYKNSAANPTLSISGCDAKPLYYDGAKASSSNTWADGETVEVYFDGAHFQANNVAGGGNFATGQKVRETGIDNEPTAGSDNLVKSSGVKISLYTKKPNDAFISNDLVVQNYGNIVWGKYMIVSNNVIEEVSNNASAYIRLPIESGCKSLFTIADEVYSNVSVAPIFVDENNNYLGSGVWQTYNIVTSGVMPENIPDNAAFVYINFAKSNKANFMVFAGLPLIGFNNNLVKGDISEVCDCEIFDRISNLGYINSYLTTGDYNWVINAQSKVSVPIRCYKGDVFSISGWCATGTASDYNKNVFFFTSNGKCTGFASIKQEEYTYTVQDGVDYIAFGFAASSRNTLSIKRIKSGRVTTIIPVDVTNYDSANQAATAIELKGIKYNLQDASLLEKDNNLLKNAVFTPKKYVNSSGVEVDAAASSYTHLSITGKIGYILGTVDGWGNVSTILIFTDGINVLGYTSNIKNEVQYSVYGQYQAFAIPSGTTDIYINVALGHEEDVKLYIGTEEITFPPYDVFDEYLSKNLISDIDCKHYLSRSGNHSYNTSIRSSYPIPVKSGEEFRYTNWTTQALGPATLSPAYVLFDKDWNFLSYGTTTSDPTTIAIPNDSTAKWIILNKIKDTTPTFFKTKLGTDEHKFISDSIEPNDSTWNSQIWVGLGDPLTEQSSSYPGLSWSPYVEQATGLIFKNCGIGSTCLAGNSTNAFWKRVSAVEEYNPNVVTILGGANDLYNDIPIGDETEFEKAIELKDCTNFIGAYSYIIETLLTWKKTLRIVILTTAYAHSDGTDHTPGIGLTYGDYSEACRKVAHYYGLPIVDLYYNMGLNKITQDTTYTRGDKIHWNAAASKIVASLVISKLKEINNV